MKASASISESGAKASISGSQGKIGISPTGIELALNAGVGQLGISTDYGGGVIVGIAGQKIVWGREGGYIDYKLGGLELKIEARDCIVVETRKIAGQIVGSHTYPDPGCKPPIPGPATPGPATPIPSPLPPLDPDPTKWPKMDPKCRYNACILAQGINDSWNNCRGFLDGSEYNIFEDARINAGTGLAHKVVNLRKKPDGFDEWKIDLIVQNPEYALFAGPVSGLLPIVAGDFGAVKKGKIDKGASVQTPARAWAYYGIFTPQEMVARLSYYRREVFPVPYIYMTVSWGSAFGTCDPPIGAAPLPINSPSAGNRPPMPESCCESLKADIEDIKKVLATKQMLDGKLTFPWRLRMPGGEGEEIIKNYPSLARAMVQVIDHLGIHPPKLSIKDINNAIAGDQGIENQFPCATQGFEALMAQVWDANADVDTLTNFLYRLSWLCVQQSMNLAVVSADIQSIKDMIGGATQPDTSSITTPFNIGAGVKESTKGKGFGKNQSGEIDKKIDANTELSTESLLPDFLKVRENSIIIEKFSGDKDIYDMLSVILLKLETLSAR